ncbi:hypothetical protein SeMB42_g06170 [Synchytrium endobioticum]|uniref:Histone chaperone RTT106/FACT complex subunit SPT16-like middle domain-containing protein n=1 Tax=Synchytrium endobioticum TaxID=286115 RepID=A0A507CLZ9_9FUNG|nr:hypothetical protein SeMB42_g06170 [Synchytrium endobioticum]TPX45135.1 hypothetical protein SeLEV6574_g04075 [Synchytrium endobioticum]
MSPFRASPSTMITTAEAADDFPSLLNILDDAHLQSDISNFIKDNAASKPIIQRILKRVSSFQPPNRSSKKRKLDASTPVLDQADESTPLAIIHDTSVTVPVRKRCDVVFTKSSVIFKCKDVNELVMPISAICHVLCLPTPEKTKPHWTFVLVPNSITTEPVCFGMDDKGGFAKGTGVRITNEANETKALEKTDGNKLPALDILEHFVWKSFIGANMGSRAGFLYCLKEGIFFGFKRPLLFVPMSQIKGVGVASVAQRTFSFTVDQVVGGEDAQHEFSYIDIAEYDNLSDYLGKFKSAWRAGAKDAAEPTSPQKDDDAPKPGESDEDDDDFALDSEESDVAEEYDSDHDSDGKKEEDLGTEDTDDEGVSDVEGDIDVEGDGGVADKMSADGEEDELSDA